jgi:hypothetical protein
MVAASATLSRRDQAIQAPTIRVKKGGLAVADLLVLHHVLSLYDTQGRCVAMAHDPFVECTNRAIPTGLAPGRYLVRLEIMGQGSAVEGMLSF